MLAERLGKREQNSIVLAIVRGGTPVGREVAVQRGLPFDIVLIRRLVAPGGPGSELCGVSVAGTLVLDEGIADPNTPETPFQFFLKDALAEFRNREQVTDAAESRVTEITRNLDAEKRSLADKINELDGAKARTGGTEVVAPAPGLIVERSGEVGQPVTSDKDLFQIATQLSLLEVVLEPDPPTLMRIQAGQPALVVLPDQGGEGLSGRVKGIQGNQAVVAFTSPNPAIKPGMMAQVRIRVN